MLNKSIIFVRVLILSCFLLPTLAEAATKYWIGPAGGSFGTNANWSTTAGSACGTNANTTAPGAGDIAHFVGECTNSAVLAAPVNVTAFNFIAGYTGTVTQNPGVTLTVAATGIYQEAGTFIGGNSTISTGGMTLNGGTFTSTTGTLIMWGNFTANGAGTFNHNSGTVQFFTASGQALSLTGSHTLNNLTIGGAIYNNTLTISGGTTLTVSGTLNLAASWPGYPVAVNGGAIVAQGNIVQGSVAANGTTALTISGTGAQTLTGGGATASMLPLTINKSSGTLTLVGTIATGSSWTYTAGTLDAGTSTVQFFNTNSQSLTLTGSQTLNNVTLGGNYYNNTMTIAGGTTLTVSGTLTSAASYITYPVTVNGGTIAAQGNIVQGSWGASGTTALTISGTGAQTLTGGGATSSLPPLTINKGSGTLTLVGTIATGSHWTYTAGTLDAGTSTVQFLNKSIQSLTFTGSQTLNNVTIGGNFHNNTLTIAAGTTLTVSGTLNFAGYLATWPVTMNGGGIVAQGNIVQGSVGASGTTLLTISGTGAQTFTGGGAAASMLALTINKGSGTLTLAGTIATGRNWTYTAGTLDAGTSTVQFFNNVGQSLTLTGSQMLNNVTIGGNFHANTLTIAGGATLTVSGTLNFASSIATWPAAVNGGAIVAQGNIVQGSVAANGTTPLTISGTGAQTFSGGGTAASMLALTINKGSGTLTLAGTIATGSNWTYTAGTLDAGTSTVQFFNATSQSLALTGSHTLNNVTISGYYLNVWLTIAAGTTLTVSGTLNFAGAWSGYPTAVNGGTIAAQGNVVQGSTGATGTTLVTFSGTTAQTWSSSGGQIPGSVVTVNKASGVVTLGSAIVLQASQALSVTAGTLSLNGYGLTTGPLTVGAAGTLRLFGSEVTASSKTFQPGSTVVFTGNGNGGANSYTLSALSTTYSNLTLNSTDGTTDTYSLAADVTVNDVLTLTSGNITTAANTLVIGSLVNVAASANGGVATASSTFHTTYPTTAANNGERSGVVNGAGGTWADGSVDVYPDWLQISFSGAQLVSQIDLFTLQDNEGAPAEPTLAMTFALYGLVNFQVQYWDGSAWATVTGGNVTGNNKIWRQFTFAPVSTTAVRVLAASANGGYSRVTELEAWGLLNTPAASVVRTSGHVIGNLRKQVGIGSNVSHVFEVGTGNDYTPVSVNFATVSGAGLLTVSSTAGEHGSIASSGLVETKDVNRYFTLTNSGIAFTSYSATFEYVAGDIDVGANPNAFDVANYASGAWTTATPGTRLATSTQATGLTTFGAFAIGELPPPPVIGSFNAYETATAAGAITGFIKTKVGASAFNVSLIALNVAKDAIQTVFTGEVKVELLNGSDNSGILDANNCNSSWVVIQTISNPTFAGGDSGRKTASFTENNSWPNARLRISYPATGAATVVGCSNDNFAIRPSALTVTITDGDSVSVGTTRALTNSAATGGVVHKAGQPFTVTAAAPAAATNYAGTPSIKSQACALPAACVDGALAIGAYAGAGTRTATATYSEAGTFNLELEDATFAVVDAADGSSALERAIPQSGGAAAIGRFIPNNLVLTLASSPTFKTFNSACGSRSFTYVGQPFGYLGAAPQVMITAQNASGATTANYKGALWKLVAGSVTRTYAAAQALTTTLGGPSVNSNGDGTGTIAMNAGDVMAFTRTTPLAPFIAAISLTVNTSDASENGVAGNGNISASAAAVFNPIAFDSGDAIRFGRLRLTNGNGSELIAMPVALEAQYFNGSGFITNTADNCTTIAPTALVMSTYQKNLNACETSVSMSGALAAGKGNLKLSTPGKNNNGSVNLSVNLSAVAAGSTCIAGATQAATAVDLTHLQGSWSGVGYDQNPSARATFGLYRNTEKFVYMRENF